MRREVDKMKGKLLGVLGVLLLAVLAAPAIAATVYIEPNTTTVAPGDTFEVSLKVRDGTTQGCRCRLCFQCLTSYLINYGRGLMSLIY